MHEPRSTRSVLIAIFAAYACARVLEVFAGSIPHLWIVALDVLSAAAFAFADGSRRYGWRAMLVFAAICLALGNVVENVGVATGFPYGRYRFLELMGPKIGYVPVLLGLAYIGMAYVSFVLARQILAPRTSQPSIAGRSIFVLPLLAGLIMTTWDLAQDPVWATILHGWVWQDGGAWFGVPPSNYFGWYLTVFLIYLLFAIYLTRRPIGKGIITRSEADKNASWPAPVFYALCAAGNVLQLASRSAPAIVTDPTGKPWHSAQILGASAIVSVAFMGTFVFLALRNSLPSMKSGLPGLTSRASDLLSDADRP